MTIDLPDELADAIHDRLQKLGEQSLASQFRMKSDPKVPGMTYAWMIPYLTKVARGRGWAIAFHGSMCRDLDAIAVPWTDNACPADELVEAFARSVDANRVDDQWTEKPHGRRCRSIYWGLGQYLDLSVMDVRFQLAQLEGLQVARQPAAESAL